MERVLGGVQVHLPQPEPVPGVELVAKDGPQVAMIVSGLEEWRVGRNVLVAYDLSEQGNCAYWAE